MLIEWSLPKEMTITAQRPPNGILITARLVGEDCLPVGLRKNCRKTKMNRVRDAARIMRYIEVPS